MKTIPSRYKNRSSADQAKIYQILDSGLYCVVAFERAQVAHQIPTGYCRIDDMIYVHASAKSDFINTIIGKEVSFSVTLLDGLVLAPRAFDHSFNYRSVIGFSIATEVTSMKKKLAVLNSFTDRYIPDRIADVGIPTSSEINTVKIVAFSLDNSAAKIREGGVNSKIGQEDPWSGIIPIEIKYGTPQKSEQLPAQLDTPKYIQKLVGGLENNSKP